MGVGVLAPVAIQQFFDNNGHPLVGGRLWFFLAGTEAPSLVYADTDLVVAHPDPIVLDAAGRAPVIYFNNHAYKLRLETAQGVTLWTADNINATGNTTVIEDPEEPEPVPVPKPRRTGEIIMSGQVSPPEGTLACDGAAVSRATYPDLFAVIGATWGAGDGTSTFNVPDLRGRAPVGTGAGPGLTARAVNAGFGEESVVLTEAQLAAHAHAISDPGHFHSYGTFQQGGVGSDYPQGTGAGAFRSVDTGGQVTGIAVAATGGNAAHPNVPPSRAVPFYIYYQ